MGSAQTGTGKTAAYVLPTLHRLYIYLRREAALSNYISSPNNNVLVAAGELEPRKGPLAIILCPSTELAAQVMEKTYEYARELPNIKILGIYGALRTKSTQVCLPTFLADRYR